MAKHTSSPALPSPFSDDVTIEEILQGAQIVRRTFNRWMDAGLLPKPLMVAGAGGRGRRGVWPAWVPARAKRIKELHGKGISLGKINEALARETKALDEWRQQLADSVVDLWFSPGSSGRLAADVSRRLRSKRSRDRGSRSRIADVMQEILRDIADEQGLKPTAARALALTGTTRDRVREMVGFYYRGFAPVLLWDGERAFVLPDLSVSHALHTPAAITQYLQEGGDKQKLIVDAGPPSYVVIPLWSRVDALCRAIPVATADHVPVLAGPATRILWWTGRRDESLMEYDVHLHRVETDRHPAVFNTVVDVETGRLMTGADPAGVTSPEKAAN